MVTLELYKNCAFNNGCFMSKFNDLASQNAYFDSLTKKTLTDVKISKLSEPILIEDSIDSLFGYKYGRIKFNDNGYWYYFSINRYEIERTNKTWLYYDIDPWETFRYQDTLSLGRGHVSRHSRDIGGRKYRAYTPNFIESHWLENLPNFSPCVIVTFVDSANNEKYVGVIERRSTASIGVLLDPDWNAYPMIDVNAVLGCWLSPFPVFRFSSTDGWTKTDTTNTTLYTITYKEFVSKAVDSNDFRITTNINYQNTEKRKIGVTDMTGTLVWQKDDGDNWNTEILFKLNVSLTACKWTGYVRKNGYYNEYLESFLTIMCEPVDLMNDYFKAYLTTSRAYNIESRRIQNEQAFINSLSNAGTSALMGGMTGNPANAVLGLGIGILQAGITSESNKYYSKQITRNEDAQARVQYDSLRLEGTPLIDALDAIIQPFIIELVSDTKSYEEYESDLNAFGYFYDKEVNSIDAIIQANDKISCTCEIENIPAIYIGNIAERLSRGVQFINP